MLESLDMLRWNIICNYICFQFAGVQCRTLRNCPDGTFSTDDLVSSIRPDDMVCYFPFEEWLGCIEPRYFHTALN